MLTRAEVEAILSEWALAHGYVDGESTRLRLGLTEQEWRAAARDGTIPSIAPDDDLWERLHIYRTDYYASDITLTPEQRQRIADATHLTKAEGCARLGISGRTFDRWKRLVGLRHICLIQHGSAPLVHGYRQSDIDDMQKQARSRQRHPKS